MKTNRIGRVGEIEKLRAELEETWRYFRGLPNRGGFSALSLGEKIDRIQKRLDAIGEEGKRYYPKVNIEVG